MPKRYGRAEWERFLGARRVAVFGTIGEDGRPGASGISTATAASSPAQARRASGPATSPTTPASTFAFRTNGQRAPALPYADRPRSRRGKGGGGESARPSAPRVAPTRTPVVRPGQVALVPRPRNWTAPP